MIAQVFEDEEAGEVTLPLSSLGAQRPVYLGRSIEGVLRRRKRAELALLFRRGYVCIRRFRAADCRLLPLVLDPPRLLKYKAEPSEVAVQVGLQPAAAVGATASAAAVANDAMDVVADAHAPVGEISPSEIDISGGEHAICREEIDDDTEPAVAPVDLAEEAARARALRLFSLYVDAGGSLCMQQPTWRKIVLALHPDRGGSVGAFQLVSDLKRNLDAGETIELPPSAREPSGHAETERLYEKIEAELRARASE